MVAYSTNQSNFIRIPGTACKKHQNTYSVPVDLLPEEDGRWSVSVPILPGCVSWGETVEHTLVMIQDAFIAVVRSYQDAGEVVHWTAELPLEAGAKRVYLMIEVPPEKPNS